MKINMGDTMKTFGKVAFIFIIGILIFSCEFVSQEQYGTLIIKLPESEQSQAQIRAAGDPISPGFTGTLSYRVECKGPSSVTKDFLAGGTVSISLAPGNYTVTVYILNAAGTIIGSGSVQTSIVANSSTTVPMGEIAIDTFRCDITSFGLTIGSSRYAGIIIADEITVYIPKGILPAEATFNIIHEGVSIDYTPDTPVNVYDGYEQVFTVTAENGEIGQYTLTVIEGELGSPEAVYSIMYFSGTATGGANISGSVPTGYKIHDKAFTLSYSTFERDDEYWQTGWSAIDGGPKVYDLGATYTTNANLILYPFWEVTVPNIDLSTTWLNDNNWVIGTPGAKSRYTWAANSMLTVPNGRTLRIMPGTTITFSNALAGGGILVQNGGIIRAEGTASSRITLKGLSSYTNKGSWNCVEVQSATLENVLDYVDILNGGSGTNAYSSVIYINAGFLAVTNCNISGSASNGIATYGLTGYSGSNANTQLTRFANNRITDCNKAPIYVRDLLYSLRNMGAGNTYSGNANNYIHVNSPGALSEDMSLNKQTIPYRFFSTFTVNGTATFTVEPGTVIEFDGSGSGITIGLNAKAIMAGTAQDRIIFRGATEAKGSWNCIEIQSLTESVMNYVDIQNGGSGTGASSSALYIHWGIASITNCTISGSASNGTSINSGAGYSGANANTQFSKFENNSITNCDKAPVYVTDRLYSLRSMGIGNTFTGNTYNYIQVANSATPLTSMTLEKQGIPYYFSSGLNFNTAETTLTIMPGAEIWFGQGCNISIGANAKLVAIGTVSERIIFKGYGDTAGWWNGIDVNTAVPGTRLAYCDISGGGYGSATSLGSNSCLTIRTRSYIELLNVKISKSTVYGAGIYNNTSDASVNPNIWSSGVTFEDCTTANVWYSAPAGNTSATMPSYWTPDNPLQ